MDYLFGPSKRGSAKPVEIGSMKISGIALGLALLSTAAGASSAAVCTPDPLLGAQAVSFAVLIGDTLSISDQAGHPFRDRPGSEMLLKDRLTAAMERRFTSAGYEFEVDETLWYTRDQQAHDCTGVPHHTLYVSIFAQTLDTPDCDCSPSAFWVSVDLQAEFLAPEYESVETYSRQRLGMATSANLESEILAFVSAMVDEILSPGATCPPLEKTTLYLKDSEYSLVLTPPGYGDLLRYLRRELVSAPVVAELFSEPRGVPADPLMTFPLVRGVPPKRILRDAAGRVVALHTWPRNGSGNLPLVVLYGADGSILRSLSVDDLLAHENWYFLQKLPAPDEWPYADNFIDEERAVLVLSIPTCLFFEVDCRDRYSQLEIDLDTGQRVHPDQRVLPRWGGRFKLNLSPGPPAEGEQPQRTDVVCRPGWSEGSFDDAKEVSVKDLLPEDPLPMPGYTDIANKARVIGRLLLEILVSDSGEVLCAGIRKGLPMGLSETAVKTALTWKLSPPPSRSGLSRSYVELRSELTILETGDTETHAQ